MHVNEITVKSGSEFCLAAETFTRAVALADDSAVRIHHGDGQHSTIFQAEAERRADPIGLNHGLIEIERAFEPVQAGNGKAGLFDEALKAGDGVEDGNFRVRER